MGGEIVYDNVICLFSVGLSDAQVGLRSEQVHQWIARNCSRRGWAAHLLCSVNHDEWGPWGTGRRSSIRRGSLCPDGCLVGWLRTRRWWSVLLGWGDAHEQLATGGNSRASSSWPRPKTNVPRAADLPEKGPQSDGPRAVRNNGKDERKFQVVVEDSRWQTGLVPFKSKGPSHL